MGLTKDLDRLILRARRFFERHSKDVGGHYQDASTRFGIRAALTSCESCHHTNSSACSRSHCGGIWTWKMNSPNAQWIMDQIEFNYKGRWIVQREILIKDRMAMFEKRVSNSATEWVWKRHAEEKIGVCERELENRDKEYQRLQEKMKQQKPMSGPLQQKYFETREQNEFWFLTDFLRDECAARGGCCEC